MEEKQEKNKEEENVRSITVNPKLPPLWVDVLDPSIRADGVALIRLIANLPEGAIEHTKFITTEACLKEFVDILCDALEYYPSKQKKSPKK